LPTPPFWFAIEMMRAIVVYVNYCSGYT
jgi:hypothetical protein